MLRAVWLRARNHCSRVSSCPATGDHGHSPGRHPSTTPVAWPPWPNDPLGTRSRSVTRVLLRRVHGLAAADTEPRTGRARLSYRRAAEVFRTASRGWTLHQLRHSRLTHLAEAGVPGPLLMAKSRHGSVKTLNLYAKPTFDAVAEATARLDPVRRRGARS